jgi:uncharacterized protein involved in exopolysaccharide biosynthesis
MNARTKTEDPSMALDAVPAGELHLSDLALALSKHRKLILGLTLACALFSLAAALLLPKVYTGTAVLMPPQQDPSSATAVIGQLLGGAAGGAGVAAALGLKNPNDLYVGILQSRTIADRLIERFGLQELYGEDSLVDTREKLADNTIIVASKDGLIRVEFEDKDPRRAAEVANAYVQELEALTGGLAMTDAARRRLYFQKQVDQARAALSKADRGLKAVQEKTGLIKPDEQAKPIFEAMATLRGQIAAKEISLAAMGSFATDQHPAYLRGQQELQGMKKQLAGFERDNKLGGGDILIPTSKVPEVGLQWLEQFREVKYYETVYEILAKQLEFAKVDEGKNAIVIQLVDRAAVPDKESRPRPLLIVVLGTVLGAIASAFLAFMLEAHRRSWWKNQPL